jgi:4-alpha-glucanotransferase
MTTAEWAKKAPAYETAFARKYLRIYPGSNLTKAMVRAAMNSVCKICVIPIQDWLELGEEARINMPGRPEGNWTFRIRKRKLSEKLAARILKVTEDGNRC